MASYRSDAHTTTILFLAADPVHGQPLQLGDECRAIENKVRSAEFRDRIRFRSRWAVRPDDLLQALHEDNPSVLHFSGHGAGSHGLYFQSDDGSAVAVSAEGLAHVMCAAGSSVKAVVLNACFSEVQAQALIACVPCVIGMPEAIGDRAAIQYAESFYRALAFGSSVKAAHENGIAALTLASGDGRVRDIVAPNAVPNADHRALPRLLIQEGVDAENVHVVAARNEAKGPANQPTVHMVIVLDTTLQKFEANIGRVTAELRRLSGDVTMTITDVEEGSVRLTLALSPEAARRLVEMRANGGLVQVCEFDVSAVQELRVIAQARSAHEVARAQRQAPGLLTTLSKLGRSVSYNAMAVAMGSQSVAIPVPIGASVRETPLQPAVELDVDCDSEENYLFAYITDIAATGIFIRTSTPEPPGTQVLLRFSEGEFESLSIRGEVIWINPHRPGTPDNLHPGMGIRLIGIDNTIRDRMLDLIRRFAYLS
jgi:Tfp pilus assembly protein PilZ